MAAWKWRNHSALCALVHFSILLHKRKIVRQKKHDMKSKKNRKHCHIYPREVHLNAEETRNISAEQDDTIIRTRISKFSALVEDFSKSFVFFFLVVAWLKHIALEMNIQYGFWLFAAADSAYEVPSKRISNKCFFFVLSMKYLCCFHCQMC